MAWERGAAQGEGGQEEGEGGEEVHLRRGGGGERELVVSQGQDGDGDEDGDEVLKQPRPQKPLVLPMLDWLQKAPGKDRAV